MSVNPGKPKLILVGGGGHCKVVLSILKKLNSYEIVGIADRTEKLNSKILGVAISQTDRDLEGVFKSKDITNAFITLGSVGNSEKRRHLFDLVKNIGFNVPTIVSPDSIISEKVNIGEGTVIMPGAIINSGSVIGSNCIINTGAIIDHDCSIGDHVHIAPGVTLSGGVNVESGVHIGTGATLIQSIVIGEKSIIGAGAVVLSDMPPNSVVVGVPAKVTRTIEEISNG